MRNVYVYVCVYLLYCQSRVELPVACPSQRKRIQHSAEAYMTTIRLVFFAGINYSDFSKHR